jgi:hypothetical protein
LWFHNEQTTQPDFVMKKITKTNSFISLFVVIGLFSIQLMYGQQDLTITKCNTSDEVIDLVNDILLAGIDDDHKDNISFSGDPAAVGYFTSGYIFDFEEPEGIVLSTGFSEQLVSSNSCTSNQSTNTSGGSDPDLQQLAGQAINDACIIEFDIKSYGDSIKLNTVFSSEEYHEWVNTQFNDVYGIFISGPGISGPYTNNAVLISLVPDTTLPVAIVNVNCGNAPHGCDPVLSEGYNCDLLVDNLDTQHPGFAQFTLDGYTTPIIARQGVGADYWYHIKIAIGDAADNNYDSGLFLEKEMDASQPPEALISFVECQTEEEVIALVDTVLLHNVPEDHKDDITFTGDPKAVAYFTGGEIIGFESNSGLVMTNGWSDELNSANSCSGNLSTQNLGDSDEDLVQLSGESIYDAGVIEFDYFHTGDSMAFKTIFGSEDYHDWVDSDFADAFGIFINGPGIEGPFLNNAVNIGLVPGTDMPVNVNTINCGLADQNCDQELPGGPNCEMLIDNLNTSTSSFSSLPFDGYTVPLYPGMTLIQNEWYHVKIAIGDCVQPMYDSGIFFERGMITFDSVYVAIENRSIEKEIMITPNPAEDVVRVTVGDHVSIRQINLYDLNGRKLKTFDGDSEELELSALPMGLMIIEVKTADQTVRGKLFHK